MKIDELEEMLKEAKKGIAKVDKTYVNYDEKGHLFDYQIDYQKFLSNISQILKSYKKD
jgi:hypothetical protein